MKFRSSSSVDNDIPTSSIRECCIKRLKHARGFYWEYSDKVLNEKYEKYEK
jgi:hypothetical protein